jgi:hypothetical protein
MFTLVCCAEQRLTGVQGAQLNVARKPQAITVGVSQHKFARSPRRIVWQMGNCDAPCSELQVARIRVWDNKVNRSANLTVTRVLRQKDGLTLPCSLYEVRIAWPKLMTPIHDKTKSVNIKRQACLCAGNAKLRDNGLCHIRIL